MSVSKEHINVMKPTSISMSRSCLSLCFFSCSGVSTVWWMSKYRRICSTDLLDKPVYRGISPIRSREARRMTIHCTSDVILTPWGMVDGKCDARGHLPKSEISNLVFSLPVSHRFIPTVCRSQELVFFCQSDHFSSRYITFNTRRLFLCLFQAPQGHVQRTVSDKLV